jgi:hypothetical protein
LFGGRKALHPEGERPEWQNDASYQAKRTTPAITSVDSGLAGPVGQPDMAMLKVNMQEMSHIERCMKRSQAK